MESIIKFTLCLSAVFFSGCVMNQNVAPGDTVDYKIYGQNLRIPSSMVNHNETIIKKECRANGKYSVDYRGDTYIAFNESNMPICDIKLDKKVVIEEIKYNRDTGAKIAQKALDYVLMPLDIVTTVLTNNKPVERGGTHGIWKLGVGQSSEYGYAFEGSFYTFGEDEQFDVIVRTPFNETAVDRFKIALAALYYPKTSTKPRVLDGFVDEVEIKVKKTESEIEDVVFYTLKNRNDIAANDRLLTSFARTNSNAITKAKGMSGLKISSDYFNPKPKATPKPKSSTNTNVTKNAKSVSNSQVEKELSVEDMQKRLFELNKDDKKDIKKQNKKDSMYIDFSDGI